MTSFAFKRVSQSLNLLEDPYERTLCGGATKLAPKAHLEFSVEIVGQDRADHVAFVGSSAAALSVPCAYMTWVSISARRQWFPFRRQSSTTRGDAQ